MNDVQAKNIILQCLKQSERIFFSNHAKERMQQRLISDTEVNSALKHGRIIESACQTPRGSYKTTLESYEAGRNIQVAVAINSNDSGECLVIVTVIDA